MHVTLLRFIILGSLLIAGTASAAPKPKATPNPNLTVTPPSPPNGKSLTEAFSDAVKRTETIPIQQEALDQVIENETQAKGALFPTISGSATLFRQQQTTPDSPTTQRTVKLTLDQPLFRGLRDFAALRQRKDLVESQRAALQDSARQLFYQLANAYYSLLQLQSDERNYQNEIDINNKHIDELKNYVRIGRSPVSDLLTFQVNASSLRAQLENTRGQIENAKDLLAFVTGWDRNTPLADSEPGGDLASDLQTYLGRIEQRPDIQIAQANLKAAEENLPIARGGHLPNLDLMGNYYIERPNGTANQSDWDASLVLTLPIFQGGIVQSQVRQAASEIRQSTLLVSQARRSAEEEIRTFYNSLASDLKQQTTLTDTATLSQKNYEAELHDYREGLVNNIQVMTAITANQDAQRLLDRQKLAVKMDWAKLRAAAAQRPELIMPDRGNP